MKFSGVGCQRRLRRKKTAGQIEKETNRSPRSSQPPAHRAYGLRPGGRTLRKKIFNNLCDLRVLCGEILFENGVGFHEVSYKRFRVRG